MKVCKTGIKLIKSYEQLNTDMKAEIDKKIMTYEGYVTRFAPDNLNENQFSALVSFGISVGVITLKNVMSNNTISDISNEILKYNKIDGKIDKSLIKRRKEEYRLFNKPVDSSYAAIVMDLKTSVRKGAGKKYDKTGSFFKKGDIVNILRTNSAKTWGLTNIGWVSLKYIQRV